MQAPPVSEAYQDVNFPGFSPFDSRQEIATRFALNEFEQAAGVTFKKVDDGGILQFATADYSPSGDGWSGEEWSNWRNDTRPAADVFVYDHGNYNTDFSPCVSVKYSTLLHEIGHALGLKHPGQYSEKDKGMFLPEDMVLRSTTIMSYNSDYVYGAADKVLGPLDILAVNYLYGDPVDTDEACSNDAETVLAVHGVEVEQASQYVAEHLYEPEVIAEAAESLGLSEATLAELVGVEEDTFIRFFNEAGLALGPAPMRVDEYLSVAGIEVDMAREFVLEHLEQPELLYVEADYHGVTGVMLAELTGVQLSEVSQYFSGYGLDAGSLG